MKTEYHKMLSGELYDAGDPVLVSMRIRARAWMQEYNQTSVDKEIRTALLKQLFGKTGNNIDVQTPVYVDYGCHIEAGDNFFANFNCVFLDCNYIKLGNNVFLGPSVQLYAAHHPVIAAERIKGPELASPITIGDNTTIGAGSVVVKDIPANVVAVGNPCRVIKKL